MGGCLNAVVLSSVLVLATITGATGITAGRQNALSRNEPRGNIDPHDAVGSVEEVEGGSPKAVTSPDTSEGSENNTTEDQRSKPPETGSGRVELTANASRCQEPRRSGDRAGNIYYGSEPPDFCHVLGGTTTDGLLRIFIADGLINVQRYDSGNWINQYYTYGGAVLAVNGTKISLGYYTSNDTAPAGGWGTISRYEEPVSQSKSGSTVTTVWKVDGIRIEQRIRYRPGNQYYRLEWDITNTNDSPRFDVRFFRGADTYLANGDYGNGFWNSRTNSVGVEKTVNGEQQQLFFRGLTDPSGYRSAFYSTTVDDVESIDLENSVDTTFHDNGYALGWRTETLGPSEEWTIKAVESFVQSGLVASAEGSRTLEGDSAEFGFTVRNTGSNTQRVNYSVLAPDQFNYSAPAPDTLAPGESTNVTVTVDLPSSYPAGTYSIGLIADGNTTEPVQAIAELRILEQSQPENLPPVPSVGILPDTPVTNETIRLSAAGSLDPNGDPLTYEWDIGADGDVDATGRTVTTSFRAGTYVVNLTVSDGQRESTVTGLVRVFSESGVPNASLTATADGGSLTAPIEIPTGTVVRFSAGGSTAPAGREVTSYAWSLGSGQTASGQVVSRQFDSPGNYTVSLQVTDSRGRTDTVRRRVVVTGEPARPVIANITQPADGLIAQSDNLRNYPNVWRVNATSADGIRKVTFNFPDGTTVVDRDGSDGWTAAPNTNSLVDGDVTIVAVDGDGDRTRKAVRINTFDLPAWGVPYRVTTRESGTRIVRGGAQVGPPTLNFNVLVLGVTVTANGQTRVVYPIGTRRAELGGIGRAGMSVTPIVGPGLGASAKLNVTGISRVRQDSLRTREVVVTATINRKLILVLVALQTPIGEATIQGSVGGIQGLRLRLNTTDEIRLAGGSYITGLTLTPLKAGGAILAGPVTVASIEVGGTIKTTGTTTINSDGVSGTLSGSGKIFVKGNLLFLYFKETVGPDASISVSDRRDGGSVSGVDTSEGWQIASKRSTAATESDGRRFTIATVDETSGSHGSATLTDDDLGDREPDIATTDAGTTVVWSAQQPTKTLANGTDLVARTRQDRAWLEPVQLTNDTRYEAYPAVAAANGITGIVWSRANRSIPTSAVNRPMDVLKHFDIVVGTRSGDAITERTRLTNDSYADFRPTIVGTEQGWLVAWVQDTDVNLSTTSDRRVRYALLGDGLSSVRRTGTFRNATAVDVGTLGGDPMLALRTDRPDGTDVRRVTFASDGTVVTDTRFGATNVTGVAATDGTVAWLSSNETAQRITTASDNGTQVLNALPLGATGIELVSDGTRTVIAYQAAAGNGTRGLYYHVRGSGVGSWTEPTQLNTSNVSIRRAAFSLSGPDLSTAFASSPSVNVRSEIVTARTNIAKPDLAVSAEVSNITSINATVRAVIANQGGSTAEETTLTLQMPGGTVYTASIPALQPGEQVVREFTAVTPIAGTASLSLDPSVNLDDSNETNDNATAAFETDLAVVKIEDRRSRNGTLLFDVTVANEGPLPVEATTYRIRTENATVTGTIHGIGVNMSREATVAYNGTNSTSVRATVTVDPDNDIAEPTDRNNRRTAVVRRPDVGVVADVKYAADPGLSGARKSRLFLTSGDTGNATALVRTTVGNTTVTYRVPLPPAESDSDAVFKPVVLSLPSAANGDDVRFSAIPSEGRDTDLGNNVALDTVDSTTNASVQSYPALRIGDVHVEQIDGRATAVVTVTNPHGVVVGEVITVGTESVTVGMGAVAVPADSNRTVRIPLYGAGSLSVRTHSDEESIRVNGSNVPFRGFSPPTNPDGDGELEDLNGDGEFTISDVQVLFDNLRSTRTQGTTGALDINDDGEVDLVDVQALYVEFLRDT